MPRLLVALAFCLLATPAAACWTVTPTVVRVLDGDTFDARVPVWLGFAGPIVTPERIRVLGVDTPELRRGPEASRARARQAAAFTAAWLAEGPIEVTACVRDSLGRVLGRVTRDGANLADALIAAGLGVAR